MHILFVNSHLIRHRTEPGAWARQLVADLRAAEATVTTIPRLAEAHGISPQPAGGSGGLKRFARQRLPGNWLGLLIEMALFLRAVRSMARSAWAAWRIRRTGRVPDVVYARAYEFDWSPPLVAAILGRPLVLEVHSPYYLERQFRGRGSSRLIRRLDRAFWARASFIRVPSKPVLKLLAEEGVDPERVRFIPYGVEAAGVEAAGPDDRINRSADGAVEIIFVGSFFPWHGVETLIDAFALARQQRNDLRLSIVGDGLTRPASETRVRELGIAAEVEFTGWLRRAQVGERLQAADIAVAPFLRLEPFYFDPVKVLEYMASGLPTIASEIERVTEMLDHGRVGVMVPPGDASALAAAILKLAGDAQLRARLGSAAREIIAERYTPQGIAEEIIALCRMAMASPRGFRAIANTE